MIENINIFCTRQQTYCSRIWINLYWAISLPTRQMFWCSTGSTNYPLPINPLQSDARWCCSLPQQLIVYTRICHWQINGPLQHPHLATFLKHTHKTLVHTHILVHSEVVGPRHFHLQSMAQWRISCDAFQGFTQITQQLEQAPSRALTLRVVYSTYKRK